MDGLLIFAIIILIFISLQFIKYYLLKSIKKYKLGGQSKNESIQEKRI